MPRNWSECWSFIGRWLVAAAFVALVATPARAGSFYVRKTGNDSNAGTSPAAAWRTMLRAALSLNAGDTVYVGAGTYNEIVTPFRPGTAASPIKYIADKSGAMTGDAGDVEINSFVVVNRNYIHLVGFRVKNSQTGIVWVTSSGGLIDDCEVMNCSGVGLDVTSAEIAVTSSSIHSNGLEGIRCRLASTVLVKQTAVKGNGAAGIFGDGQNINLRVERSLIASNAGDGVHGERGTFTLINNLIYSNGNDGFEVAFGVPVVTIWNCTIAGNSVNGVRHQTGTMTLKNCIVAFNSVNGLNRQAGTMTHSHNLVFGNTTADYVGTSAGTGEISIDPSFINRFAGDFHLNRRSPAINVGTSADGIADVDFDGVARPIGPVWDMGCYESRSGRDVPVRVLKWTEVP